MRRYSLDGLLPKVRRPGEGMIVTFGARERRTLGASAGPIEAALNPTTTLVDRKEALEAQLEETILRLAAWELDVEFKAARRRPGRRTSRRSRKQRLHTSTQGDRAVVTEPAGKTKRQPALRLVPLHRQTARGTPEGRSRQVRVGRSHDESLSVLTSVRWRAAALVASRPGRSQDTSTRCGWRRLST